MLSALAQAALFLPISACHASIGARETGGHSVKKARVEIAREFNIQSTVGLQVDAATSGLGFGLVVPPDVSPTPQFKLVVSLDSVGDEGGLGLTMQSDEVDALERPSRIEIPRTMLQPSVVEGESALAITDLNGLKRILAPGAIKWNEDVAVVSTSQPLGQWSFVSADEATSANGLIVTVTGLAADESIRYDVAFAEQHRPGKRFDVAVAVDPIKQKITGNGTRYVAGPAGTDGNYELTLLEAPLRKTCVQSSETGLLRGQISISIACQAK